ncbi:hypothetical protein Salat_1544400 [Sesamum alatum]|uniref:RNase H type-1 domain-containing protein n=1 Tax=Sesamum alatum TaxID=300844 RepID=A0AAE1YCY1_9LAMI|nr:hypothetical protein Salat_1544400 [Sesamum alatum]
MWVRSDECENIIRKYWNEHDYTRDGSEVGMSIERCRMGLLNWSSKTFGNSLIAAQGLIQGRHRWGIGNGEQVRIWGDRWIPREFSFIVHSAPNIIDQNAKVCELIKANGQEWDDNKIFGDQRASTSHSHSRITGTSFGNMKFLQRSRCFYGNEDELHVLLSCSFARIVWALSNIPWKGIKSFQGASAADHAEALAARSAIEFAVEQGWTKIVVEGDALNIIQRLQQGRKDGSSIGPILADITALAANFEFCSFTFIGRVGNYPAHLLARLAFQASVSSNFLPGFRSGQLC